MKEVYPPRYASTIFCDDARNEVGNKLSLMGIYQGQMRIAAELPVLLPKLVAYTTFSEPVADEPEDLQFRLIYWAAEQEEAEAQELSQNLVSAERQKEIRAGPDSRPNLRRLMTTILIVSPFPVPKPGTIAVRVVRGEEVYRAGALEVMSSPADAVS